MTQQHRMAEQLFAGKSEMAKLMRSYDWSQTSLGSPERWSQSLKTAVRIVLTSRQPMFVWWGDDLINLYNDAYKAIVGGKHPTALGQPASVVWQEIWDQIGPRAESAILKNEGTYDEALLLIMERNGYPEETYYTFSYSPTPNDQGEPGGIICANTDDTQRIIGERQLALLRDLAAKTADARTFNEACTLSASCLETNLYDLPFAMIYLVDPDQQRVSLAGTAGIDRHHAAVPETVELTVDSPWSFRDVIRTHRACLVSDLAASFDHLPTGAWQQSPHQAVAVPIAPSGQTGKAGILIVGLNPFRLFDDSYRGFIDLIAAQISASIANAQAYEEERKRAEALAELDRAKTTFFSNISHEFRTPLTLMLSPLEELAQTLDGRLQPDEHERLALVQRNGLRLQKLVNTLLDFSRIEAGRVQAFYEPTDLATYTAELASIFRSLIEQAGMNLVIDCPALPEPVYVDRDMWEKIVLNLLSNAFKFTFAGSITVRLQPVGHTVELSVCDTGVGIPDAELPRLFERFHRVSGTRSRTYEGSGIGLALVQELIKLHGGTIRVASQLEQGTSFTIALPFGSAHLPSERLRQSHTQHLEVSHTLASTIFGANPYVEEALRWLPEREAGKAQEAPLSFSTSASLSPSAAVSLSPSTTTARLLLADDNADMRDYVKRLLSQYWEVETVSNGLEALQAVARRLPDLILSDVMMPMLDGFGLIHKLRGNLRTREIPIILLSARAGEEARIEGLEAGADDYLTKPFSARELLARVESNLKLARLRQEAAQQEQALRLEVQAAKESMESVLTRIADQFSAWDRDWRCNYVNDRVTQVTGIPRKKLLGRTIWELFPETVGSQFDQALRRAVAEQTPVQFEYFYPPLKRWFENHVYPSADGISLISTDITDRKQAEADLRQSKIQLQQANERFERAAAAVNCLIYDWDVEQDRVVRTDGLTRILGYSLEEAGLTSEWWRTLIHPDDLPRVLEQAEISSNINNRYTSEYRVRHKNGQYVYIQDQGIVTRDANGRWLRVVGSTVDITERKLAEAEREQLLAREQAAREHAETANRIKDEFLAVLSHELRSPLNPILGWAKLLRNGKLDAITTEYALETIERNAQLQVQLIDDLLDISRILRGKLTLNVTAVDLSFIISAALETVHLAAEAKALNVQTITSPTVVRVNGDAGRLQQVVWNLLSNAVKFTPAGGHITIELAAMGTNAQIQVRDSGKGINPDFLPYVFEYFRQQDGATTRQFGGLGLGLAIVRQIVEMHGGTVAVESPGEGQGATFTVQIPLAPQSKTLPALKSAVGATLDLSGMQILVVDDDADSRDFMTFVLKQANAIVTSVASGMEALQCIYHSTPDIVVSDIGMPDMDGYMLMQQIRALEKGKTVPAIALTAYAGEINQKLALDAGFQQHLPKPVEPDTIVMAIARLVYHDPKRML